MFAAWKILRTIHILKRPYHLIRAEVAKFWVKSFSTADIIGITGSVGKTTTKEAIAEVLSKKFKVLKTPENFDPIFNIPKTLLKVRSSTEKIILEMGIEYPGEMDYYLSLVKPNIGVITQLSLSHSEFLGNIGNISKEKWKLIQALPNKGWAVLNWDDLNIRNLAKKINANVFWYGSDAKRCDLYYDNFHQDFSGSSYSLIFKNDKSVVHWKLIGRHNITAALAAASVGIISGLNLSTIAEGLSGFKLVSSRINVKNGVRGSIILDDCYNSSPKAAGAALQTLAELSGQRRKIAVLSDMLELGSYSKEEHKKLGEQISKNGIDILFAYGSNSKYITEAAQKEGINEVFWFENLSTLIKKLKQKIKKGDVILVKGSRSMHLETVVKSITT